MNVVVGAQELARTHGAVVEAGVADDGGLAVAEALVHRLLHFPLGDAGGAAIDQVDAGLAEGDDEHEVGALGEIAAVDVAVAHCGAGAVNEIGDAEANVRGAGDALAHTHQGGVHRRAVDVGGRAGDGGDIAIDRSEAGAAREDASHCEADDGPHGAPGNPVAFAGLHSSTHFQFRSLAANAHFCC